MAFSLFCSQSGDGFMATLLIANTGIPRAGARIFYSYGNGAFSELSVEKPHCNGSNGLVILLPMMRKIGTYIFCHAQMAHRIHAVGRKPYFVNIIVVRVEIFICRSSNSYFVRQNHNARMAGADSNFIFGANHSLAFFTPDFGFFHGYWFAMSRDKW